MRRRHPIKSFIALLVLFFIGQGVGQVLASAAMQCEFGGMALSGQKQDQQIMFSDAMDHSRHMMVLASEDSTTAPEHCFQCDCATGNCGTAALPVNQILFTEAFTAQYSNYSVQTASALIISLYRPPISR